MHKWPGGGPPLAACWGMHSVPGLQVTIPHASPKMAAGYCLRSWNKVREHMEMKHKSGKKHKSEKHKSEKHKNGNETQKYIYI
jgi:hypothetical protein